MKKHTITYIITTAVLIGIAFLIGRNTVTPKTQTITKEVMPEKVDLSDNAQFDYINSFLGTVIDWNTDGKELAVYTVDGYELYAEQQESVYPSNIRQYIGLNNVQTWEVDSNVLTITTNDGNSYTFNK